MERIDYAGKTLLTGSAIAHAVLGYAQALAQNASSATVTIPVQHEDGSIHQAEILIGPASQLVAERDDTGGPELEDDEVVSGLTAAAARLAATRPHAEATADYTAVDPRDLEIPTDEADK